MKTIQESCYLKAVEVLKQNSTKFGILASGKSTQAQKRSYRSIFGRDAAICSMGMVLSGDKKLLLSARRSLETLARYQADNGQIAFWVKPEQKKADFYYLGCLDSTLWWLIAIKFFDKNSDYNLSKKFKRQTDKAINYLLCQEHPNFYLLQQNEASDWADLMPRTGFVLYSNALWYWVKRLYNIKGVDKTKEYFNYIFNPLETIPKKILVDNYRLGKLMEGIRPKKKTPMCYSFVNRNFWGEEGDVYANILTAMVGLLEEKQTKQLVSFLKKKKVNQPYPVKAVLDPITKKDALWRTYMEHLNLNQPNHYHNGGIWPYIGSFWVMLLSTVDTKYAEKELKRLAELNKINNWQFNEWFDSESRQAMGMPKQSWSAAMFILAYHTLEQ